MKSLLSKIMLWPGVRATDSGQRSTMFADSVLKTVSFACFLEVYLGQHEM
ncbi:MAG: hypothetical protein K9M75_08405 [Phycisphaerae bacterium]|nr:hypothetical protein [Phycisphaerae bacterium]